MNTCLIIVDMQQDFITDETIAILNRITRLMDRHKFDYMIATKFINHIHSIYTDELKYYGCTTAEGRALCRVFDAYPLRVFNKESYSCLTKEVLKFINDNNIDKLYLVGLETNACIMATALDAFGKGISTTVVKDCCACTQGASQHDSAIKMLEYNIGDHNVINSDELK
jgi:nicotinamidase-related amidase